MDRDMKNTKSWKSVVYQHDVLHPDRMLETVSINIREWGYTHDHYWLSQNLRGHYLSPIWKLRNGRCIPMSVDRSKAADSLHSKTQSPIDVNYATRDKTFLKDLATLKWKFLRFYRRIALFPGVAMSSCSPNATNRQGDQEVEWRAYRSLSLSSVA